MAIKKAFTGISCFLVIFFLPHCRRADTLFQEVSAGKSGITFNNQLSEGEDFNLIEYLYYYNGGGVALGDINNDGLVDLYFSGNQVENKLYLNKGNWRFEDITEKAGVASPGLWKTGVSMADVNGDGLLDIYQCRLGAYKGINGRNQLFINNGDLTFSEQAAVFGLDFSGFSTQAAFADFDLDGDLDMYLLNHSVHTSRTYGKAVLRQVEDPKAGDRLYWNNGGKFIPVTREAGIYSSQIGYGLGVGVSDLNGDGWPDLYISNDFNENDYLYLNTAVGIGKQPVFREAGNVAMAHSSRFSMGNDLADYNNDGQVDMLSLDMLPEDEVVVKRSAGEDAYEIFKLKLDFGYGRQFARNALQLNLGTQNDGTPVFSEIAMLAGIHATDWSWAPLFADFDNDGYKDLFISNGIRRRPNDMDYINFISNREIRGGLKNNPDLSDQRLVDEMPDGTVPNVFFRNNGDLTFSDQTEAWGGTTPTLSNGSAYADLDNDGDLDLVVNHINRKASVLRNNTRERDLKGSNGYLQVVPEGSGKNPFGIGVKLLAYSGNSIRMLENYPCRGFQSSVPPILHLGLGEVRKLDSIQIIWPGGKVQVLKDVPLNRSIRVKASDALDTASVAAPAENALLIPAQGILPEGLFHSENQYNDFNTTFLQPHMISREGPPIAIADVNGDGREDMYFGNAKGAGGGLLLQTERGLMPSKQLVFEPAGAFEVTAALFFDANGDGSPDLYLVTAGNEVTESMDLLKDRLLINDGKGHFEDHSDWLPGEAQHGGAVTAADFDRDGDLDLFVGGRTIPGQYGISPRSYLLQNDGTGRFKEVTDKRAPELAHIGMVTSACWVDLDGDQWQDLVVAGEWMPIIVLENQKGALRPKTIPALEKSHGWWRSLEISDMDGDGDLDILAGNQGKNARHVPSPAFPLHAYIADFDANGSLDPILAYTTPKGIFPMAARDDLSKQMPSLKKKFLKHRDFAGKTIAEIFGGEALEKSLHLQAHTFASIVLENRGNFGFLRKELPLQAQFAPIFAILVRDINQDGIGDVLIGGNQFSAAPYFGTYDAGKGLLLQGVEKGHFQPLTLRESGLNIPGEIRAIRSIRINGEVFFIFGINNGRPLLYRLGNS
jgi:hypothetical protein